MGVERGCTAVATIFRSSTESSHKRPPLLGLLLLTSLPEEESGESHGQPLLSSRIPHGLGVIRVKLEDIGGEEGGEGTSSIQSGKTLSLLGTDFSRGCFRLSVLLPITSQPLFCK